MGRRRIPEHQRREFVGIRLPKWLIEKIEKQGKIQEVIEAVLIKFFKKD